MPKGKMTGNPTNIVCWLLGGYFNDTVWGVAYDKDNLLYEIEMGHYENPRATAQGVKILGITETSPDDVSRIERYKLTYYQEIPPAFAVYCLRDSTELKAWEDHPAAVLRQFKRDKGFDLPDEYLDPTKMPGQTRQVKI